MFLSTTYGRRLGKAKVTGCCIRFKSVNDVDVGVIEEVVADAMGPRSCPLDERASPIGG